MRWCACGAAVLSGRGALAANDCEMWIDALVSEENMMLRTGFMRRLVVGCVAWLLGMMISVGVSAEGFDLQQFNPMPNLAGTNMFSTAGAGVLPHLGWSAIALFNYANDPLVLRDMDQERVETLVSDQGTVHLLFAVGLMHWIELGVDLPLAVWQEGRAVPGGALRPEDGSFGVGDLRLVPKLQLFSTRSGGRTDGIAIALLADVFLPTGDRERLQGGDFRIGPRLAFDAVLGGPRIAVNLGYLFRDNRRIENLSVEDTLSWNVGLEVPVVPMLRLTAEAFGRITPGSDIFESYNSPTEFLAGLKYLSGAFFVTAGAGAGIVSGYGTPDYRLFGGLGFAPARLAAKKAAAEEPYVPECTEENLAFTCRDVPQAECVEGALRTYFAGCDAGACIYEFTDMPCAENSACGVDESGTAACIVTAECSQDAECTEAPAATCEDNVIRSYVGRCGADGTCQYETVEQACPENTECGLDGEEVVCVPVVARVVVREQQIEILDVVQFALNSDVIEESSYELLREVARVLRNHPQITQVRVEGHTDARGRRTYNQELSERRAASVRRFLIQEGIAESRLTSQGLGPDRPVQTNHTEEGRSANRRVEFHIVERQTQGVGEEVGQVRE